MPELAGDGRHKAGHDDVEAAMAMLKAAHDDVEAAMTGGAASAGESIVWAVLLEHFRDDWNRQRYVLPPGDLSRRAGNWTAVQRFHSTCPPALSSLLGKVSYHPGAGRTGRRVCAVNCVEGIEAT